MRGTAHPIRKYCIRKREKKGGDYTNIFGTIYKKEKPHGEKERVSKRNILQKHLIGGSALLDAETGGKVGGRQMPKTGEILRRLRISLNLLSRREVAKLWDKTEYHKGTFAGREGMCRTIDGPKNGEKILEVQWYFGITRHYNRQGEPIMV
ncbi:MAG: hypothetical protein V1676_02700 [Candidatus Diapherotrites archaeon]